MSFGMCDHSFEEIQDDDLDTSKPQLLSINIVKGSNGFGFSIKNSKNGLHVGKILDPPRCKNLQEGDMIVKINGQKMVNLDDVRRQCATLGSEATFLIQRGGIHLAYRSNRSLPDLSRPRDMSGACHYSSEDIHDDDCRSHLLPINIVRAANNFGFEVENTQNGLRIQQILDRHRCKNLQEGDFIVQINGRTVKNLIDVHQEFDIVGSEATFVIKRKGLYSAQHSKESLPELSQPRIPIDAPNMLSGASNRSFENVNTNDSDTSLGKPTILSINIVKGDNGFGFSLANLESGLRVRQILDRHRCSDLQKGDVLIEVNGLKVKDTPHPEIVEVLRGCAKGSQMTFVIERGGLYSRRSNTSLPDLSWPRIDIPNTSSEACNYSNRDDSDVSPSRPQLLSIDIVKGDRGFGFLIAESASGQYVKSIQDRHRCKNLQEGDIIIKINGRNVKDASHSEVVDVLRECVEATFVIQRGGRGSVRSNNESLLDHSPARIDNTDISSGACNYSFEANQNSDASPCRPQLLTINIIKGDRGFGFLIAGSASGQYVKSIQDRPRCNNLQERDIIVEINGRKVKHLSHSDVVQVLREYDKGSEVTFVIERKGLSSTPYSNESLLDLSRPRIPMDGLGMSSGACNRSFEEIHNTDSDILPSEPQLLTINIVKGDGIFGIAVSDSEYGYQIKHNQDRQRCKNLQEGDIIVQINGNKVKDLTRSDVIEMLEQFPKGSEATFIIQRGGFSSTPCSNQLVPDRYQPTTDNRNMSSGACNRSFEEIHNSNVSSSPTQLLPINIVKGARGFGISIAVSEFGHQVKHVQEGLQRDNLQRGDILCEIDGHKVRDLSHSDVIRMLREFPTGSEVTFLIQRRARIDCPSISSGACNRSFDEIQRDKSEPNDSKAQLQFINIAKGDRGFGFTVRDSVHGQQVKQILDRHQCKNLKEDDLIVEINGRKVKDLSHSDIVRILREFPKGSEVTVLIKREGLDSARGSNTSLRDLSPPWRDDPNMSSGACNYSLEENPNASPSKAKLLSINIVKGDRGFGFRMKDSRSGQQITRIFDRLRCRNVQEGDIIVEINGHKVKDLQHSEVLQVLNKIAEGSEANFIIQRRGQYARVDSLDFFFNLLFHFLHLLILT